MKRLTPGQTVGPFFHDCLFREPDQNLMVRPETRGERIRIEGVVRDGDGAPVPDAMVELWQANAEGRYRHPRDEGPAPLDPAFIGWGRSRTDAEGRFGFETIRPGAVAGEGRALQAPHVNVQIFARGLLDWLPTRLYFADDPATADDAILRQVPEARRGTLLARRQERDGRVVYRFDVTLQGPDETVFFDG